MERVTGIGGVFIKAKDPKALAKWYDEHLGVGFGDSPYMSFKWENKNNPAVPGSTTFSFFKEDSGYFAPSAKQCMINFRVMNLSQLLDSLKSSGIEPTEPMQEFDYGKFCWIMDPEGNKIELWEPVDGSF